LNLLGIDFEDWYHPELIKKYHKHETFEPIVVNAIDKIIDWLRQNDTYATFFVVGELLELGMVQRERKGRSFELGVTPAFMEYFGIDADNQNELKAYLEQALTES